MIFILFSKETKINDEKTINSNQLDRFFIKRISRKISANFNSMNKRNGPVVCFYDEPKLESYNTPAGINHSFRKSD